jgi:hypothetical protein
LVIAFPPERLDNRIPQIELPGETLDNRISALLYTRLDSYLPAPDAQYFHFYAGPKVPFPRALFGNLILAPAATCQAGFAGCILIPSRGNGEIKVVADV